MKIQLLTIDIVRLTNAINRAINGSKTENMFIEDQMITFMRKENVYGTFIYAYIGLNKLSYIDITDGTNSIDMTYLIECVQKNLN